MKTKGLVAGLLMLAISIVTVSSRKLCPTKTSMADFDPQAFSGIWYPMKVDGPSIELEHAKCQTYAFKDYKNGSVTVLDELTLYNSTDQRNTYRIVMDNILDGIYKSTAFVNGESVELFVVFGTDYKNWGVTYQCEEVPDKSDTIREVVKVITRTRDPTSNISEKFISEINEVLRANGVPITSDLANFHNKDCPGPSLELMEFLDTKER